MNAEPLLMSLRAAVRAALDRTGRSWLRRVVVGMSNGVVVLQGEVPSFYLKQLAQVAAMAVPGVELVQNELRVEGGPR